MGIFPEYLIPCKYSHKMVPVYFPWISDFHGNYSKLINDKITYAFMELFPPCFGQN
jgi:hypothetical protein